MIFNAVLHIYITYVIINSNVHMQYDYKSQNEWMIKTYYRRQIQLCGSRARHSICPTAQLAMPPKEWKAESTVGRVVGIGPASMPIFRSLCRSLLNASPLENSCSQLSSNSMLCVSKGKAIAVFKITLKALSVDWFWKISLFFHVLHI